MLRQGRKRDPIWINFNAIKVNTSVESGDVGSTSKNTVPKAECKKCKKHLPILVARLKKHHEKCAVTPHSESEAEIEINSDSDDNRMDKNKNAGKTVLL